MVRTITVILSNIIPASKDKQTRDDNFRTRHHGRIIADMEGIKAITVFSGSSFGTHEGYKEAAKALGREMARRSISLVYGGGYRGLMGTVAEAVHDSGGHVIGVLPESMDNDKVRLKSVETELHIVPGMHERKRMMYSLSQGFIALPGGIGTMEELCEIYTWRQLGMHSWNIGLLNVDGYWDQLIAAFDRGCSDGFISREVRSLLIVESDPEILLDRIASERFEIPDKIR